MAKKTTISLEDLQYIQIRELGFSYVTPENFFFPGECEGGIRLSIDIVKAFSREEEVFRLIFTIHLSTVDSSGEEIKARYVTEHAFTIKGFETFLKEEKGGISVYADLDDIVTIAAYGTIRGLFYHRFMHTCFAGFVLPFSLSVTKEDS